MLFAVLALTTQLNCVGTIDGVAHRARATLDADDLLTLAIPISGDWSSGAATCQDYVAPARVVGGGFKYLLSCDAENTDHPSVRDNFRLYEKDGGWRLVREWSVIGTQFDFVYQCAATEG